VVGTKKTGKFLGHINIVKANGTRVNARFGGIPFFSLTNALPPPGAKTAAPPSANPSRQYKAIF
jgi:hypothetical protein